MSETPCLHSISSHIYLTRLRLRWTINYAFGQHRMSKWLETFMCQFELFDMSQENPLYKGGKSIRPWGILFYDIRLQTNYDIDSSNNKLWQWLSSNNNQKQWFIYRLIMEWYLFDILFNQTFHWSRHGFACCKTNKHMSYSR